MTTKIRTRFPKSPAGLGAAVMEWPGRTAEVPAARRWVRGVLAERGVRSADAGLVVTELFANAVEHSLSGCPGGRVAVRIAVVHRRGRRGRRGRVLLEVLDEGGSGDLPRRPQDGAPAGCEHGRGLALVCALARRVSTRYEPSGRVVGAELPLICEGLGPDRGAVR